MTIAEEYTKERDRLELNRVIDWSSFHHEFIIAGERLRAMTVQIWFDLLALKSPILYSKAPTVRSMVDYIWRHSKRNTKNGLLKKLRLFSLERRIAKTLKNKTEAAQFISVLCDHIKYSLDEYPVDQNGGGANKNSMSATSGTSSMIDEIASRYSIDPEKVLSMPVRRAFALQRVIRASTIPDYKPLEADSLRAIKSKFLQELNKNHGGQ